MTRERYNSEFDFELAIRLFSYNQETGELIRIVRTNNRNKLGPVTQKDKDGYLTLMHFGKNYRVHRIIWLLSTGSWPERDIDHINGIKTDNRLSNLRLVTNQENCWNKESKGWCYNKIAKKYYAYVGHNGKREHLGYYDTPEQAEAISQARRKELRGEFYRAN